MPDLQRRNLINSILPFTADQDSGAHRFPFMLVVSCLGYQNRPNVSTREVNINLYWLRDWRLMNRSAHTHALIRIAECSITLIWRGRVLLRVLRTILSDALRGRRCQKQRERR